MYLALGGGPPGFLQGFPCPAVLGNLSEKTTSFRIRDCHSLWSGLPACSAKMLFCNFSAFLHQGTISPTTPIWQRVQALTPYRFGLFPFRSPLLRESLLLSFPPGTEMFQFPGYRFTALWIQAVMTELSFGRVPPFGNPRVKACLQLTGAYRSSLRPSSPTDAKASTICP